MNIKYKTLMVSVDISAEVFLDGDKDIIQYEMKRLKSKMCEGIYKYINEYAPIIIFPYKIQQFEDQRMLVHRLEIILEIGIIQDKIKKEHLKSLDLDQITCNSEMFIDNSFKNAVKESFKELNVKEFIKNIKVQKVINNRKNEEIKTEEVFDE